MRQQRHAGQHITHESHTNIKCYTNINCVNHDVPHLTFFTLLHAEIQMIGTGEGEGFDFVGFILMAR